MAGRRAAREPGPSGGRPVIEVRGLTKRYGSTVAVDRLSFEVPPGAVTGFLGLNGSGKSTTMRMILGLDAPDAGHARIGGQPYRQLRWPLREAGGLLEPRAFHPGRSARAHLAALAASNAIRQSRVDEVLELVGLESVARKRAGKFSLGMAQRLGIAAALLGDPDVLLLDEPVNGLDPEGIRWVRGLLRDLADEGRTVLVSSHLMSEMEDTADHLVVLGRGQLLADVPIGELLGAQAVVQVRTPAVRLLAAALVRSGGEVSVDDDGALRVRGLDAAAVGEVAFAAGVPLHGLTRVTASLEAAYLALTHDEVEYRAVAR